MSENLRIGLLDGLMFQPLTAIFQRSPKKLGELFFDTAPHHIERLMGKKLTAALMNPISFAQYSSDLLVYPSASVSSFGMSGAIRLYFRAGMKNISTLAVNITSAAEVVLARIILEEKYDAAPSIVPVAGDLDAMLQKADAALLIDAQAAFSDSDYPFVDLVDEWYDVSELPYVHAVFTGRQNDYSENLHKQLMEVENEAGLRLSFVIKELSKNNSHTEDSYSNYLSHFSYQFSDEVLQSLEEYFRLAYYHGILDDIPEIKIPS
ncbi:MAG: hypothetical protein H3C35_00725 [Bacteroidetes bacterium]|nr:hypothetical protein [Bacteroidota bacterium]